MKKSVLFGILFLAAVVATAVPSASAESCCSTYSGFVYVNGTLAANGTVVQSVVNGANATNVTNFTVGNIGDKGPGYYIVNVPGEPGDNISFKVNGIAVIAMNGTNASAQPWGLGWHPFNLTMNTSNNGVACFYSGACTTGFCTDGYCCNSACGGSDEACSVAGSLGTCTSTAAASTGGGGGSSGGTTVSTPSESQTVVGTIAAGGTADVNFDKSATLGVESIEITVNQQVNSVSVTVKETSAPSSSSGGVAISSSDGSVYKYLEITPTVSNDKISSAKVQFKVPKTWFDTNGIDPATVSLKKNAAAGWTDLPTSQTNFDGTYYYYESTTTSFSTYAITGQKVSAQPAQPVCGNNVCDSGETQSTCPADCGQPAQPVCGNGACEAGETTSTCPADCKAGGPVCGNNVCESGESQSNCPADCKPGVTPPVEPGNLAFWAGIIILLIVILGGGYWYFTKKK